MPDAGGIVGQTAERVKATKNVMSPLQWLIAIVCPASMCGLIWGPVELRALFAITFASGPLYFVASYTYWMFREPDRLHSEEHREKMTRMSREYRDSRGIVIDTSTPNVPPPNLLTPTGGE